LREKEQKWNQRESEMRKQQREINNKRWEGNLILGLLGFLSGEELIPGSDTARLLLGLATRLLLSP